MALIVFGEGTTLDVENASTPSCRGVPEEENPEEQHRE